MPEPSTLVRVLRVASWSAASLPMLYFVALCVLAAGGSSGPGASPSESDHTLWLLWTKRLCAHIVQVTLLLPTLWILVALFAEQPKGKFIAQAVLVTGGSCILIAFWGFASQMLWNGRLE